VEKLMDLKILVVVLSIIVFISTNALPTGDGSGRKSRVSQSGVFQDNTGWSIFYRWVLETFLR